MIKGRRGCMRFFLGLPFGPLFPCILVVNCVVCVLLRCVFCVGLWVGLLCASYLDISVLILILVGRALRSQVQAAGRTSSRSNSRLGIRESVRIASIEGCACRVVFLVLAAAGSCHPIQGWLQEVVIPPR